MSAAEQAHVMDHLARLKDAGRIEVLRENRDHYHVFAFVDGARPNETLISASLGHNTTAEGVKQSHHATVSKKSAKKAGPVFFVSLQTSSLVPTRCITIHEIHESTLTPFSVCSCVCLSCLQPPFIFLHPPPALLTIKRDMCTLLTDALLRNQTNPIAVPARRVLLDTGQ